MSILKPNDDLFFNLFNKQAQLNYEATRVVKVVIDDFTKIHDTVDKLLKIIEDGDKLREEMSIALANSFITPFEREDIHHLSILLDKILGRLISAVMRMKRYNVELKGDFKEYTQQLIEIILSTTEEIKDGVKLLKNMESPMGLIQRVKKLEQDGDTIQREATAALFNGSVNAIDIIKWKEIYDQFERVIDFCEDISLKIDNVIIKHS